jgi:TusA-related sulfurtransferase
MAGKEPINIDERLDITGVVCPVTFVKVKVALDSMEVGQVLAVRLDDGEPARNIPGSLKEEGQRVLRLSDNHDGTCELLVRKESD